MGGCLSKKKSWVHGHTNTCDSVFGNPQYCQPGQHMRLIEQIANLLVEMNTALEQLRHLSPGHTS